MFIYNIFPYGFIYFVFFRASVREPILDAHTTPMLATAIKRERGNTIPLSLLQPHHRYSFAQLVSAALPSVPD